MSFIAEGSLQRDSDQVGGRTLMENPLIQVHPENSR